ncbi:ATP-binding protein [Miniimonas arenae]|uniref:ATP-binding protein n=1 Tax=Miniimonas arenae TaxID=676201 RepID=A0A5C5B9E8_9MICO|nr:ATP-binding protein [Miniimonas arenae]TNU73470.1 ATP-binding protein [Miniimonas arenae]
MAELILVVGHVGAGKTTRAIELASAIGAVRLTPDEWMMALFGESDPDGKRDVLEGRLVWTAAQILRSGTSVILDFGLWGRDERAALAWLAGTVGATARTEYLSVDRTTQSARVAARWQESPHSTWAVTDAQLEEWRHLLQEPDARELAGTYRAEPPDPGGWAPWIARRWPTALGT